MKKEISELIDAVAESMQAKGRYIHANIEDDDNCTIEYEGVAVAYIGYLNKTLVFSFPQAEELKGKSLKVQGEVTSALGEAVTKFGKRLASQNKAKQLEKILNASADKFSAPFEVTVKEMDSDTVCYKIRKDSWLDQEMELWRVKQDWKLVMDGEFTFHLTKDSHLAYNDLDSIKSDIDSFILKVKEDDDE